MNASAVQSELTRFIVVEADDPRLHIMISSTTMDLPEHRHEVSEAIQRMGHTPVMMEFGSAEWNSDAIKFSLEKVEKSPGLHRDLRDCVMAIFPTILFAIPIGYRLRKWSIVAPKLEHSNPDLLGQADPRVRRRPDRLRTRKREKLKRLKTNCRPASWCSSMTPAGAAFPGSAITPRAQGQAERYRWPSGIGRKDSAAHPTGGVRRSRVHAHEHIRRPQQRARPARCLGKIQ